METFTPGQYMTRRHDLYNEKNGKKVSPLALCRSFLPFTEAGI
jgi:hypothetical protein